MSDVQVERYRKLLDIGLALSTEHDSSRLMENILNEAKDMCRADGGTLYLMSEGDRRLRFEIMKNDSLKIYNGGMSGVSITLPPVELYDPQTGKENRHNVASYCALSKQTVNIEDAYMHDGFDFTGTQKFDEATGYRSRSFLTVPLYNNEGRVIAVLQLLNAQDEHNNVIAFTPDLQPFVEALAAQAAIALDNQLLVEAQRKLLVSFIELIAGAIDAKSAYTGGHCQRVPVLTDMLAEAAIQQTSGPFADFDLNGEEKYELHVAGLLHDCGKVTTPEYIIDKATKLETIYDRIHEVRMRFEVLKRDAEIDFLRALKEGGDEKTLQHTFDKRLEQLDDDFAFVAECNIGGEYMADAQLQRLERIAGETWVRTLSDRAGIGHDERTRKEKAGPEASLPVRENLLSDRVDHIFDRRDKSVFDANNPFGFNMVPPENLYNLGELYNLKIKAGTLTQEDRFKINDHIVQTIIMLDQLPFPRPLRRVPEYAGGHHEKMDGTGYPRGLTSDEMSPPARMMAIADVFEALTAADRPYKTPKTLSQALRIMSFMVEDSHLDGDLFALFLTSGVYLDYAYKFLKPEQIDMVDICEFIDCKAAE